MIRIILSSPWALDNALCFLHTACSCLFVFFYKLANQVNLKGGVFCQLFGHFKAQMEQCFPFPFFPALVSALFLTVVKQIKRYMFITIMCHEEPVLWFGKIVGIELCVLLSVNN